MYQVHKETARENFYNISSIAITIAPHQLSFIGKIVRSTIKCQAKLLLTACCGSRRERARPQIHLRDSIVKNLSQVFEKFQKSTSTNNGSMEDWIKEKSNKGYWTELIDCFIDHTKPPPPKLPDWNIRRSSRRHRRYQPESSENNSSDTTPSSQTIEKKESTPWIKSTTNRQFWYAKWSK